MQFKPCNRFATMVRIKRARTHQPSTACAMGILLAASFFFFSHCVWLCIYFGRFMEDLHCALAFVFFVELHHVRPASQTANRQSNPADLSNFQFKLKPYYFHDKIIFEWESRSPSCGLLLLYLRCVCMAGQSFEISQMLRARFHMHVVDMISIVHNIQCTNRREQSRTA